LSKVFFVRITSQKDTIFIKLDGLSRSLVSDVQYTVSIL